MMYGLPRRASLAAQDISEALGVAQSAPPQPAPMAAPPMPMAPPGGMPGAPGGALGGPPQAGALQPGMPQPRPQISPLQMLSDFRSPPLQAALQGAEGMKGHPALNQPIGFARGGLAVFRRR